MCLVSRVSKISNLFLDNSKSSFTSFTALSFICLLLSSWYIEFISVLLSTSFWMFILISPEMSSSIISVKSLSQLQEYLIIFILTFSIPPSSSVFTTTSLMVPWLYINFCNLPMSIFKIN